MNGPRRERGFTLVELVCVLALLGIIALIAIPRLQPVWAQMELRGEARKMAAVMRDCRSQAVLEGGEVQVRFYIYAAPPRYQVHATDGSRSVYHLKEGVSFVGVTSFERRVAGTPACFFSPEGYCDGGTVTLTDGSATIYVIAYPLTARVRVAGQSPS